MPTIVGIYRYPIKGLGPDHLESAELAPGHTIAGDRLYAIENGPSGFDPAAPNYRHKSHYLMLMKNERLARLRTRYEDASRTLVIESEGRERTTGRRLTICLSFQFSVLTSSPAAIGPPAITSA